MLKLVFGLIVSEYMEKKSGLHLLNKKLGETPNQCVMRFKVGNPDYALIPMTYAGRLDPLADGLLLVLSGDEIKEKDKYLDLKKTYLFDILWGFETDTLDVLGMVGSKELSIPTSIEIKKALESSLAKFEQKYPSYSSKPVNGHPLLEWARSGKIHEIEIPSHEVEIYEAGHISRRHIFGGDLLNEVKTKIKSVIGDFRQKEILNKWMELLINNMDKEFTIDTATVTVSSGFYVRQFVSDFAKTFDAIATTFYIKRTHVGDFNVEDSIE
jgi:tRNA pseudouridine(55) synthase